MVYRLNGGPWMPLTDNSGDDEGTVYSDRLEFFSDVLDAGDSIEFQYQIDVDDTIIPPDFMSNQATVSSMETEPRDTNVVVVAIIGVLAVFVVPNVLKFVDEGDEEGRQTELHNLQLAVQAMLSDAGVNELDDDYDAVNTYQEIEAVTTAGDEYSLVDYLTKLSEDEELIQVYDIDKDGTVTVD